MFVCYLIFKYLRPVCAALAFREAADITFPHPKAAQPEDVRGKEASLLTQTQKATNVLKPRSGMHRE